MARYEKAVDKADALQQQKEFRLAQADTIGEFILAISGQGCELTESDGPLRIAMVQRPLPIMTDVVFTFQDRAEIEL